MAAASRAKPPARTISTAPAPGALLNLKRPSGPVTVCSSVPELDRTITVAPETAPPLSSTTTPVTAVCPITSIKLTKRVIIELITFC